MLYFSKNMTKNGNKNSNKIDSIGIKYNLVGKKSKLAG